MLSFGSCCLAGDCSWCIWEGCLLSCQDWGGGTWLIGWYGILVTRHSLRCPYSPIPRGSFLFKKKFFFFWVGGEEFHVCHNSSIEFRGQLFKSQFSPAKWVLELMPSGLVAGTFTHWTISPDSRRGSSIENTIDSFCTLTLPGFAPSLYHFPCLSWLLSQSPVSPATLKLTVGTLWLLEIQARTPVPVYFLLLIADRVFHLNSENRKGGEGIFLKETCKARCHSAGDMLAEQVWVQIPASA